MPPDSLCSSGRRSSGRPPGRAMFSAQRKRRTLAGWAVVNSDIGVWLSGRALASGARGRRFKSAHPDQIMFNLSEEISRIDWKVFARRMLSNVLILGAIFYFLFSFWDVIRQEALYAYWRIRGQVFTVDEVKDVEPPKPSPFAALLGQPTPLKVIPKSTQFGMVIEKIDVNSPIIADVPPSDKRAYPAALQKGVAHAKGP